MSSPVTVERSGEDYILRVPWADRLASFDHALANDRRAPHTSDSWAGGTRDEFRAGLAHGDLSAVEDAERILERCELALPDSRASEVLPDVLGARLSVGSYLSGSPLCFRRKRAHERGPISFYVSLCSLSTVRVSTLKNRGLATLAVALWMARERPVAVYAAANCRLNRGEAHVAMTVPLGLTPIDMSDLAVALWHPGMARRWFYATMRTETPIEPGIPHKTRPIREVLGLGPHDFAFDSLHSNAGFETPEKALETVLKELREQSPKAEEVSSW